MDKFIEKINKLSLPAVILILGAMLIIVGAGLFYWRQVKLSRIYSECHSIAQDDAIRQYKSKFPNESKGEGWYLKDDYEFSYKECLREKGINK